MKLSTDQAWNPKVLMALVPLGLLCVRYPRGVWAAVWWKSRVAQPVDWIGWLDGRLFALFLISCLLVDILVHFFGNCGVFVFLFGTSLECNDLF